MSDPLSTISCEPKRRVGGINIDPVAMKILLL